MFNSNDIDAYHKITAPESLKASILDDLGIRKKPKILTRDFTRSFSAIAAGLVLVCTLVSVGVINSAQPVVSYGGSKISTDPTRIVDAMPMAIDARTVNFAPPVTITVEAEKTTTVTVTNGSATTFDMSTIVSTLTIDEATDIMIIPDSSELPCEITIDCKGKSVTYVLEFDEDGNHVIYKK